MGAVRVYEKQGLQVNALVNGRYSLVRELGGGSLGHLYEAVDMYTKQHVAAKIILSSTEADLRHLLRFQQEGATLASLQHPNIVRVHGTHLEDYSTCIIMDLLRGTSLARIMQGGRLPLGHVKHVMQQVASALTYAHSRGMVHYDLKPSNIVVASSGHSTVTDFGIARILQEGALLATQIGMSMGGLLYAAPELIEMSGIDGRVDIYSFGAVLYEMVTGAPPFPGTDPLAVAFKHVHKDPTPPRELVPDLPPDWATLILAMLAKDPRDRPYGFAVIERLLTALSVPGEDIAPRHRAAPERRTAPRDGRTVEVEKETLAQLAEARAHEIAGNLSTALHSYRRTLPMVNQGPLRDEIEEAVRRVMARIGARAGSTQHLAGSPKPLRVQGAVDPTKEREETLDVLLRFAQHGWKAQGKLGKALSSADYEEAARQALSVLRKASQLDPHYSISRRRLERLGITQTTVVEELRRRIPVAGHDRAGRVRLD